MINTLNYNLNLVPMFNWKKKNRKNPPEDIPRGRSGGYSTQNPLSHRFANSDEPPTVPMDEAEAAIAPPPATPSSQTLSNHSSNHPSNKSSKSADPETLLFNDDCAEQISDLMKDPVTGWLVIIEGPGKGASFKIGLGVNSIGRSEKQRISIDYGDAGISRENHCLITFDPKSSRFYLQHGEGQNLTYLEDQPVLIPTILPAHSRIQLSDTHLLFTPFCGEHFNWKIHN